MSASATTGGQREGTGGGGTKAVGRHGEKVAVRFLRDAGLEVLETNWRCPEGELDIVARDDDALVFCEVKTRRSDLFGGPLAAVDRRKLAKLRQLAALWLMQHDHHAAEVRIDVIAVMLPRSGPAQVEHLRGVIL